MGFCFDKDAKLVVYGASEMARIWTENILKKGFDVSVFLDGNAKSIEQVMGIPVFTLEEWDASSDALVIIMLKNATQHLEIARRLYEKGVDQVIFFPMSTNGLNMERVSRLRKVYNQCIRQSFDAEIPDIPFLGELLEERDKSEAVICQYSKEIVMWCPVELCYSIGRMDRDVIWYSDCTEEARLLQTKYVFDKNVYNLLPYWELLDFCYGKIEGCPLYLKIFGKAAQNKKDIYDDGKLLADRSRLVQLYEEEICKHKGISFFEESPADAVMGEKGRVIIRDGLHRSVFLVRRGYKWIPVRITADEYERFFNNVPAAALCRRLKENRIEYLEYPIEHPAFYGYPVQRQNIRDIWHSIANDIEKNDLMIRAVVDLSMSHAYFSRLFLREGANAAYFLDEKDILTAEINRLFDLDGLYDIREEEELIAITGGSSLVIFKADQLDRHREYVNKIRERSDVTIYVYDVMMRTAAVVRSVFEKREIQLLRKYVVEGELNGLFVIR